MFYMKRSKVHSRGRRQASKGRIRPCEVVGSLSQRSEFPLISLSSSFDNRGKALSVLLGCICQIQTSNFPFGASLCLNTQILEPQDCVCTSVENEFLIFCILFWEMYLPSSSQLYFIGHYLIDVDYLKNVELRLLGRRKYFKTCITFLFRTRRKLHSLLKIQLLHSLIQSFRLQKQFSHFIEPISALKTKSAWGQHSCKVQPCDSLVR